jgi:hypothetical protein
MTPQEVNEFVALLEDFYPQRFSRLPSPQLWLWYTDLEPFAPATCLEAHRRWVRWHRNDPPELAEVVRACKEVEHEAARWRSPADTLPLERSTELGIILKYLAQFSARHLGPWQDEDGVVHPKLSFEEIAALCGSLSATYRHRPELAHDFAVLSTEYAAMAQPKDSPFEQGVWERVPSPARAGQYATTAGSTR